MNANRGSAPQFTKASPGAVKSIDDSGIVEAVVNVFGIVDLGDDMIATGACVKTLTERGVRMRVLDQHSTDSVLRVVGKVLEAREIGRDELPADILQKYPEATGGLLTKTQYLLDTPEGVGVFQRIKSGAVDEFSIGFDIIQQEHRKMDWRGQQKVVRVIKEIRLWEYSAVIWGMNPATAVTAVKEMTPAGKVQRYAHMLASGIPDAINWRATSLLYRGEFAPEDVTAVNNAANAAMLAFIAALPEELQQREFIREPESDRYYDAADGADEQKAGRVLSTANETRIRAALGLMDSSVKTLESVLTDAGVLTDEADAESASTDDNQDSAKSQPQAEPEGSTPPLTEQKRAALLALINEYMTGG